jgi:hypothetical protein
VASTEVNGDRVNTLCQVSLLGWLVLEYVNFEYVKFKSFDIPNVGRLASVDQNSFKV